jgi:hypothetical protein
MQARCPIPVGVLNLRSTRYDARVAGILASYLRVAGASILGLYASQPGKRASGSEYNRLVRESFTRFVWPGVAGDEPDQVWVIGRGVGRALHGLPMIRADRVISQPQDRDVQRYREDLARLCDALSTKT